MFMNVSIDLVLKILSRQADWPERCKFVQCTSTSCKCEIAGWMANTIAYYVKCCRLDYVSIMKPRYGKAVILCNVKKIKKNCTLSLLKFMLFVAINRRNNNTINCMHACICA